MPWENVGSVDTGEMPDEKDWILFCLGMAKSYVDFVCEDIIIGNTAGRTLRLRFDPDF